MFALFRAYHNGLLVHHMDALFCLQITTSKYPWVLRFSLLLASKLWRIRLICKLLCYELSKQAGNFDVFSFLCFLEWLLRTSHGCFLLSQNQTDYLYVLRFALLLAFEYWNPICVFLFSAFASAADTENAGKSPRELFSSALKTFTLPII